MINPAVEAAKFKASAPTLSNGEIDVEQLVLDQGWIIRQENLGANKAKRYSTLLPLLIGGFVIQVDNRPTPAEKWEIFVKPEPDKLQRAIVRFRIAYEIGQTQFYDIREDRVPTKSKQSSPKRSKEASKLCDQFAAALLVSPESAYDIYIKGPAALIEAANHKDIHTYAWLLSADQYMPVRALAGWVRHDGNYLINRSSYSIGVDSGPMLWYTEPGIAQVLEASIKSSSINPKIERHFLAFPDSKANLGNIIIESL